jgi:hypothetical protein
MQHRFRSRQVTIDDPRAAAVFTQSPLRRILLQFANEPRAVAEVASALGIDLKQLHHAVTKLCRLGLVEVAEERKRAGRSIKLYRCTGSSYYIPCAAAPAPFSRGLATELQSAIARDTAASVEGMVFALDPQGRVAGQVVQRPGTGLAPLDSWRILRLSTAQAKRLKQELGEVLDRFQNQAATAGQVYLVHTGMARRLDHSGATDNPSAPPRRRGHL